MSGETGQVAISVEVNTRPCIEAARGVLESAGYSVSTYARGGGYAIEDDIRGGHFQGVLDLVLTDLLMGISWRVTAAGILGVPQVLAPGGMDCDRFGKPMTPEALDRVGKDLAEKACAASGPTRILLPMKGVSLDSHVGMNEAVTTLFESLRNWVYPPELIVEVDLHFADVEFGRFAARELLTLMHRPVS